MIPEKNINELKKDIVFTSRLCGEELTFHTTWGLFSPTEIDEGTKLLLEYIETKPTDISLDIGCGYGPIGITLAKLSPEGQAHMIDKDFTAVEYTKKNAALNGVKNYKAYLSNGFSEIPDEKFDLIVSNLPAKVGREFFWILLNDAKEHLNPGGRVYVVTINGLREFIKNNFKEVFGNYDKIKQGAHYTVAMAVRES